MPQVEYQSYEFGPYRIDTGERLLHKGDELIALPPKAVETLLVLIGAAGRMVDKSDLMKTVWPDTFVEEGALTRNVSLIRKALGEMGDETGYIETIPKRGYRFITPVRTVSIEPGRGAGVEPENAAELEVYAHAPPITNPVRSTPLKERLIAGALMLCVLAAGGTYLTSRRQAVPDPPVKVHARTLAVLPFRNVMDDPGQDYFADGMTHALITCLAKVGDLRVISLVSEAGGRRESEVIDAIVRGQSVSRLLTGTVLQSGGRIRIDAQLMDPKTRAVTWANSYERDVKDVLALEASVAEAITTEIQVVVTTEERLKFQQGRKVSPAALDAYLRGRYLWNRRTEKSLRRAVQYFQQAIAAEPGYASAYSGLADSYSLLGSIGFDGMPPKVAMPLAKAAALKAIELDPALGEGHASLGYVKLSYDWDLNGAAHEFSQALALEPTSATAHHWYSHYYMAAGDLTKATEQMQLAARLEPLSPSINLGIGWCYYYSKEYDKAVEQYRSVTEMDPGYPMAHQTLGMAYQQREMYPEAINAFRRAVALSENSPTTISGLASAYAAAGKEAEARRELLLLEQLAGQRYVPAFYFATIHQSLGDTAKMFEFGWKALGEQSDYLIYLHIEPRVGKLAGNSEFMRILGQLHR